MTPARRVSLALVFCLAGCTAGAPDDTAAPAGPAPGPTAGGCAAEVATGELPGWARAGFSADATVPHVVGDRGDLVAVLFGHPLHQPPSEHRSNKILWVSRVPVVPGEPLTIDARLGATGRSVSRQIPGGPGPSVVDLPEPGCWTLTLTWSGHQDVVHLRYVPP
jgi:hypothetical protein